MERIQSINAKRIQWCCNDRSISPEELASKTRITWDSFEKMMAGEDGITFDQLRRVADFLNRGMLFFLEPGTVTDEQVHTAQFRTIANQKPELSAKLKALIERVEQQREVYLSLREDLDELKQSRFSPPKMPPKNLRRAAEIARKWLGFAEQNSFDTYRQAVEDKGILVFRSSGFKGQWQIAKGESICGFTLYHPTFPIIVIRNASESRQDFTLMHELGHVLLHQSSFIDEDKDLYSYRGKEREANVFAGHLLVPDDFLKRINVDDRPNDVRQYDGWLHHYRKAWTVSGEVILRRLLDSGRLQKSQYDAYRDWKKQQRVPEKEGGSRKYRHREPKHMFGEPFVRTVLDALQAKQISLSKASTYLDNLKITDVHKLEGFYAGL